MITLLVICLESLFSENCLNRIGKSGEIVRTRNGNELKQEVETLSAKLRELTEEELAQVTGGSSPFEQQLKMDIDVFDVVNPDTGLVKDNEDLELNKLEDRSFMGTFYPTLK